jgi:hypothetical protein
MERDAVIGVSGGLAQIRGHFRNEIDGPRAAQNARRAAAAEFRVDRLVPKLDGHATTSAVSTNAAFGRTPGIGASAISAASAR